MIVDMTIMVVIDAMRSIHQHHPLAQEIQGADTNPTMIATPAREPFPGPQEPTAKREIPDDAHGDGRVVERPLAERGDGREAESDDDEGDPERGHERDGLGGAAEGEGAAFEVAREEQGHGDRDAVGDVEADGGDRGGAVEGDLGAQDREGEEKGAGGGEDDGADGGFEAVVDHVEAVGDGSVAGEGEHHSGVACLRFSSAGQVSTAAAVVRSWRIHTKLNNPQCQAHSMISTMSTTPPLCPQASVKI